jgi:hypothetical protein
MNFELKGKSPLAQQLNISPKIDNYQETSFFLKNNQGVIDHGAVPSQPNRPRKR